jgi:hypothetical protein
LLKGDYSDTDFSNSTFEEITENPDFVNYQVSKWNANCTFTADNLEKNQEYTIIPVTQLHGVYYFGLGENVTFTIPDITLITTIKKITADTVKFRLSRTGTANGALGYVLLKGDLTDVNYKTLDKYKALDGFVANYTSKWTGGITATVKNLESGETYTIVPYTQKKGNYFFGLGENITFTVQ